MKRTLAVIFFLLAFSISQSLADEPELAKAIQQKIKHVDFEISLEHYKQVQMEHFKTQMRLRLLDTKDGDKSDAVRKEESARLKRRAEILKEMTDQLRAEITKLGNELSVAAN